MEVVNELVEANVFVQDNEGFKVHFKVPLLKEAIVPEITAFLEDLHEAGFVPDATFKINAGTAPARPAPRQNATQAPQRRNSAPPRQQQASDVPDCFYCGGAMWDNRRNKRNPQAPDFKCKDKDGCNGAAWERDDGELNWKQ